MNSEFNLDSVLISLGQDGKFQVLNIMLLLFPVLLFSSYDLIFIFTTGRLDYRCKIPQCETNENLEYNPNWLKYAVPFKNSKPKNCERYSRYDEYLQNVTKPMEEYCTLSAFNTSHIIPCNSDFVYRTDEITMVNEFNLTCDENEWRLTTIGSIGYVTDILTLPLHGILSDRYGRRTMIISSLIITGIFGIILSFSTSYIMYGIFEFIISFGTLGAFQTIFIVAMEWLLPKHRVFGNTIVSIAYSLGQILLGIIAMNIKNFRNLIRIMYSGSLIALIYIWFIPESIRWQLSIGHHDKVKKTLRKVEKINGIKLPKEIYDDLDRDKELNGAKTIITRNDNNVISTTNNKKKPNIFQSKILFFRALNCAFCLCTNSIIYMGLNINAIFLGGNKYLNFIALNLIELPANVISYFLLQKCGRRLSFSISLITSGLLCGGNYFIPDTSDNYIWHLVLFLLSKCFATISYTICYMYITELFPTNLRQSYMNICYTFATLGSSITPHVSLLMMYMPSLPMIIYASSGTIAGLLALILPETHNIRLPDTIEEAENIGKTINNVEYQ